MRKLQTRQPNDNYVILGYYAASSGNFLPTFRDNQSVPSSGVFVLFLTLKMGPMLSRNVDKKSLLLAA